MTSEKYMIAVKAVAEVIEQTCKEDNFGIIPRSSLYIALGFMSTGNIDGYNRLLADVVQYNPRIKLTSETISCTD